VRSRGKQQFHLDLTTSARLPLLLTCCLQFPPAAPQEPRCTTDGCVDHICKPVSNHAAPRRLSIIVISTCCGHVLQAPIWTPTKAMGVVRGLLRLSGCAAATAAPTSTRQHWPSRRLRLQVRQHHKAEVDHCCQAQPTAAGRQDVHVVWGSIVVAVLQRKKQQQQ
jgi:hypothetical protein